MDILKYIAGGLFLLFIIYIVFRVFIFGAAKSVIEAIQQSKQFNKKENENGIKEKTGNEREIAEKNRTKREDKER